MKIAVGDLVNCVDFEGGSGEVLSLNGKDAVYLVQGAYDDDKGTDHLKHFLVVTSVKGQRYTAYASRFVLAATIMSPDFELDEIHAAQALVDGA